MEYVVDLHTHTIVSGHAYNTLFENIKEASEKGIKILGTSEHGPKMPGGPHIFYFGNIGVLPRKIYGVTVLRGCEANIINSRGELDIPEEKQKKLDYIIASLHDVCIEPGNINENTEALLRAMDNPNVHILGHLGNPAFPIVQEEVVKKAKERDIIIEINNSSLVSSRVGSDENCNKIAELCKRYKTKLILGSDAHVCFAIGKFDEAIKILKKVNMEEELIMNKDENKIINHLKNKGKLGDFNLD